MQYDYSHYNYNSLFYSAFVHRKKLTKLKSLGN